MWRFCFFLIGWLAIFRFAEAQPITHYVPLATPVTDTCAIFTYQTILEHTGGTLQPACMVMLPKGNYILAVQAKNEESEKAILINMSSKGTTLATTTLELPGKLLTITDLLYSPADLLIVGGIATDVSTGNKQPWIATCNTNGTVAWMVLLNQNIGNGVYFEKLLLSLADNGSIFYAFGLANQLLYGKINQNGITQWQNSIQYPNEIATVKAGYYSSNQIYVAVNSTDGGLSCGYLTGLAIANGQRLNTLMYGGVAQNSSFILHDLNLANNRPHVSGIYQKPGEGFEYFWHRNSNALLTEYFYTVKVAGIAPTAFATSRLENSARYFMYAGENENYTGSVYYEADALRPGKTSTLLNQPNNVRLADAALGTDDGIVKMLGNNDHSKILLVKTDSLGNLGDCLQTNPELALVDSFITFPPALNITQSTSSINLNKVTATQAPFILASTQTCFSNNCSKPAVLQDCATGFIKQYNFYSPAAYFSRLTLTKADEPIMHTAVVNGWGVQIESSLQSGIAVFNSEGEAKHSALAYLDNRAADPTPFASKKEGVYLLHNTNNLQNNENLNIHLSYFNKDLEPIWERSIRLPETEQQGFGNATLTEDANGNIYVVAVRQKANSYSHIWVIKLNTTGEILWSKNLNTESALIENIQVAVAANTVFITAKENNPIGSMFLRLNAVSGAPISRNTYGVSQMHLAIAEAGLFATDQYLFMLGNTQGGGENMPLLTKTDHAGTILQSVALPVAGKMMHADFKHQQFSCYLIFAADNNYLIKLDSAFNGIYARNIFTTGGFLPSGIQIGSDSSVYMSGVYINGIYRSNGALLKFSKNGELGNCTSTATVGVTINVPAISKGILPIVENDATLTTNTSRLQFLPETIRHATNLCQTHANCDTLILSGPSAVCTLNSPVIYQWQAGANCTQTPLFSIDSSMVNIVVNPNNKVDITFLKAGTAIIAAQLTNGCNTYHDTLAVIVNPTFNPPLLRDTTICAGDTLTIRAPEGITNITWNDGSSVLEKRITTAGRYWLTSIDPCGLPYADTIMVYQNAATLINLPNDTSLCNTQPFMLAAPAGISNFRWNTGDSTNFVSITQSGTYSITGADEFGCTISDSVQVLFIPCISGMHVPNAFTPDGNRLNDVFKPLTDLPLTNYSFAVYSRWGQLLFQSSDIRQGWDGRMGGKQMPAGTYIWQLNYETQSGIRQTEKGKVTLIR